jgi:AraC-like DNA-binding protein
VKDEPIKSPHILAETIKSALTTLEFAALGARSSLFVLETGASSYFSEDLERKVEAPCLIWSPTQHPARLSLSAGSRGFVLRIPEKIIGSAMPTGPISSHVRKAVANRIILPNLPATHLVKTRNQFEQIEAELFDMAPGALSVVYSCISLLLIEIWRASGPADKEMDALPHQIVDDFLHLVEQHLQSHWTVAEYARRIGVSSDRLNSAVRRAIGTSPHRHIQSRLMEEAKSLLVHSNLYVAEVAYKLGFNDAAYFNRFFQRHSTVAPGRFRQMNAQAYKQSSKDSTFAAWP